MALNLDHSAIGKELFNPIHEQRYGNIFRIEKLYLRSAERPDYIVFGIRYRDGAEHFFHVDRLNEMVVPNF